MHSTIVFTTAQPGDERALRAWARFRDHIESAIPLPVPAAVVGRRTPATGLRSRRPASFWRLLAGNHRELGRSFLLYESASGAQEHVDALLTCADELTLEVLRGSEPRTHGWFAALAGRPVLTCSRWYSGSAAAASAARCARESLTAVSPPH